MILFLFASEQACEPTAEITTTTAAATTVDDSAAVKYAMDDEKSVSASSSDADEGDAPSAVTVDHEAMHKKLRQEAAQARADAALLKTQGSIEALKSSISAVEKKMSDNHHAIDFAKEDLAKAQATHDAIQKSSDTHAIAKHHALIKTLEARIYRLEHIVPAGLNKQKTTLEERLAKIEKAAVS